MSEDNFSGSKCKKLRTGGIMRSGMKSNSGGQVKSMASGNQSSKLLTIEEVNSVIGNTSEAYQKQ